MLMHITQEHVNGFTVDPDDLSYKSETRGHHRVLTIFDTVQSGFGVAVTRNQTKTYVFWYRPYPGGRATPKKRYTIGRHGRWTTERARREARRLQDMVNDGRDPQAEKRAARHRANRNRRLSGLTVAQPAL